MKPKLTHSELSVFAEQLALILHSGISVSEGILILQEDSFEKTGAELLGSLYDSIEQTGDFSQSLAESGSFPEYFIQMTRLGERSGTLEEVLTALSDYYKQQDTLLHSMREALIYPLVLLSMLTAVLTVLISQVMPVFSDVFRQLGLNLSGTAQAVFHLSGVLQNVSAALLLLLLAAVVAALYAVRSVKVRAFFFQHICRIPFFQTILLLTARSRFAHALSIALHSGLDLEEGFSLAAQLTQDLITDGSLARAQELLTQGNELGSVLKESGIFSGLDASLISIGFRTGSAETALLQISQKCEEKAEQKIQKAVGIIEPTLTAVLSILTGTILVSVMLPLLNILSNIG